MNSKSADRLAADPRQVGFNVISYVSGNLGIGVTARNVVRVLKERGCPIKILDLDPGLGRKGFDRSYESDAVGSLAELPHPINLIVLPPAAIGDLLPGILACKPAAMNVGFCMWELPALPDTWIRPMQALDALVAESDFIRYAFEFNLSDVLTIPAAHPLYLPPDIRPDRARFGLPQDAVIFYTGFEPVSDPQRKNPFATVRAFLAAFGDDPRAQLVLKFNNARVNGELHPVVRELEQLCAGHPRIRFLNESLAYEEVLRLYASCDVFVSLHRSEGLGLGPMEAMALGRPAIATAWSGNMSYMDHTNAALVGYRLVPVDGSISHYSRETLGKDTVWAEPDIEQAAAWMRRLVDEPALRAALGQKAAADIARHHARAREGRFVDELHALHAQLCHLGREQGDAGDSVRRVVMQRRSGRIHDFLGWRRKQEAVQARAEAYRHWLATHTPRDVDWQRLGGRTAASMVHLLVRVRAGSEERLAVTLDSIGAQSDGNWRLTVVADTSPPSGALGSEERLRWRVLTPVDDEAMVLNEAAQQCESDWVLLLEAGDRLAPHALVSFADAIERHPAWRLVYADQDQVDESGRRSDPHFKPDFNLELLRSRPYLGPVLARRAAVAQVGGWRGAGTISDYDLVLRIVDHVGEQAVGHVADVLLHRAGKAEASYDLHGAAETLARHLARRGIGAHIESGPLPGTLAMSYRHDGPPSRVSVIIPTRDRLDVLQPCLGSLLQQTCYPDFEVLVVDNASRDPATLAYLEELARGDARVRILRYPHEFNYAAINNFAAAEARGEYLLLLNNDTAVLHPEWLERMMAQARRADVGAVGARLVFPDRRLQHAGIVLGMGADGIANHLHLGLPMDDPGYLGRAQLAQEVSAVTGACLLVRKSLYREVGGMDADRLRILYNDVDLCLKLRSRGYRIIWTPFATLLHHGSVSVGPTNRDPLVVEQYRREVATMHERWQAQLAADPYYNRNLSLMQLDAIAEVDIDRRWRGADTALPGALAIGFGSRGSWEYRVRMPMENLDRTGRLQASVVPFFDHRARVPSVTELARLEATTVLMHNTVHDVHLEALKLYRRHNRAFLVFGQDDLMTQLPAKNPFSQTVFKDMKKRLRAATALCDRLIVTTEPLAAALSDLHGDIRIVPNYLERSVWTVLAPARRAGARPRVGWAGAQQHEGDLELLHEVVRATASEVDWVFLGMCPEAIRAQGAEFHVGVPFDRYPEKLASLALDLALAPLEHNRFNECKSNLRILECGALGWPVLASDIEPYRAAPVTRLPNNPRAWINAIRERIHDIDTTRQEGLRLREWVHANWMLEDHLQEWVDVLSPTSAARDEAAAPVRRIVGQ
jgi:GT2 family glycosyltransferase